MSYAAVRTMEQCADIVVAHGYADKYQFVLSKNTGFESCRASKIVSKISTMFASSYIFSWAQFFPHQLIHSEPMFDASILLFRIYEDLRDYLICCQE